MAMTGARSDDEIPGEHIARAGMGREEVESIMESATSGIYVEEQVEQEGVSMEMG